MYSPQWRHNRLLSTVWDSDTQSVSGGSVTEATISNLTPSTTYNVGVAAVNDAGTGDYSNTISIMTLGIIILYHSIILCSIDGLKYVHIFYFITKAR